MHGVFPTSVVVQSVCVAHQAVLGGTVVLTTKALKSRETTLISRSMGCGMLVNVLTFDIADKLGNEQM